MWLLPRRPRLVLVHRPGCPYCAAARPHWERCRRQLRRTHQLTEVHRDAILPEWRAHVHTVPRYLLIRRGAVVGFGDSKWTADDIRRFVYGPQRKP